MEHHSRPPILTEVRFRALEPDEIARYVATEQPLDCAGSFKCEGLGISLFDAIDNRDPTALIGLPLITLWIAAQGRFRGAVNGRAEPMPGCF